MKLAKVVYLMWAHECHTEAKVKEGELERVDASDSVEAVSRLSFSPTLLEQHHQRDLTLDM